MERLNLKLDSISTFLFNRVWLSINFALFELSLLIYIAHCQKKKKGKETFSKLGLYFIKNYNHVCRVSFRINEKFYNIIIFRNLSNLFPGSIYFYIKNKQVLNKSEEN